MFQSAFFHPNAHSSLVFVEFSRRLAAGSGASGEKILHLNIFFEKILGCFSKNVIGKPHKNVSSLLIKWKRHGNKRLFLKK